MAASEPIRNIKDIKKLANYFLEKGELKNHLLIVMGVYTALRVSDLLKLTWSDVYDFNKKRFKKHIYLIEQKTGKRKQIALNTQLLTALKTYKADTVLPNSFLFYSERNKDTQMSRNQAWRIVKKAANDIKIEGNISCHSLRKTFGYHAWKNSISIAIIMNIYNHSSFEVTKIYLGISQDDIDKAYMDMKFF